VEEEEVQPVSVSRKRRFTMEDLMGVSGRKIPRVDFVEPPLVRAPRTPFHSNPFPFGFH
jgi:hypothetical protein